MTNRNTCEGCALRDRTNARCPERDFVTSVDTACQRFTTDLATLTGKQAADLTNLDMPPEYLRELQARGAKALVAAAQTGVASFQQTVQAAVNSIGEGVKAFEGLNVEFAVDEDKLQRALDAFARLAKEQDRLNAMTQGLRYRGVTWQPLNTTMRYDYAQPGAETVHVTSVTYEQRQAARLGPRALEALREAAATFGIGVHPDALKEWEAHEQEIKEHVQHAIRKNDRQIEGTYLHGGALPRSGHAGHCGCPRCDAERYRAQHPHRSRGTWLKGLLDALIDGVASRRYCVTLPDREALTQNSFKVIPEITDVRQPAYDTRAFTITMNNEVYDVVIKKREYNNDYRSQWEDRFW